MKRLLDVVQSPANWAGLALATVGIAPQALGWPLWGGWALAPIGYAVGFTIAGMWFGWPWRQRDLLGELDFDDQGDAQTAMRGALDAVRRLVQFNPEDRLSPSLQARVLELCAQMETLLAQWERSRGSLSLEESFQARHIALRYLPEALKTYLSIPARFARTKVLANGQTAEATFAGTVDDLSTKVLQLTDDLASQDADAFLNHSRFLEEKFRPAANPVRLK